MGNNTEQLEMNTMKVLIIFNTKYRKVRIQREFKNKDHVENYISLMHRKYSWFVDELYY